MKFSAKRLNVKYKEKLAEEVVIYECTHEIILSLGIYGTKRLYCKQTSFEIFLQASTTSIQLLFRQGERPFPRKFGEVKVRKLPLKVLMQNGKFPVAF